MKNFLDRGSDYKPTANSCKFYVSVGQGAQDVNKSAEEINLEKSKPKLLDGEIIITEGNRVLFFPNVSDKTKGLLGNLYVTNFRFIFDAYEEDSTNEVDNLHQKNNLLGEHGACLSNIDSLYQLIRGKKRRLFQDSQLTEKIKGLQINCKTMKVFTFNFDQSPITQGKNIAKTLLHHAFPGRHQLLFAYDYSAKECHCAAVASVKSFEENVEKEMLKEIGRDSVGIMDVLCTQNQRLQTKAMTVRGVILGDGISSVRTVEELVNFSREAVRRMLTLPMTQKSSAVEVSRFPRPEKARNNAKVKAGKHVEGVVLFSERSEWENELARTCSMSASSWRISTQNQRFQMSTSLPKWLIVPHSVLDCDFVTASQSFRCNRPPIWTWSSPNGAALVRMADLLPTISDRTQENRMLENVRKCHPNLKGPCIKYLDKELPSVTDLFQSYARLRDLCMPDNRRQFEVQDSHLYSSLENTKWLHYVSSCLKVVVDAAQEIQRGTTIVLQESDGRDMSAVIASLVQLALDSHTRSIVGFQSLVQKEWIALGHPFCRRLGHVRTNNSEQSPVFLLFLDCVWQLQNQFPSSFEFTETYLTTLWDSVHISIFDTFLFDCEKDRIDACMSPTERLEPRSVWNWNFQFSERDLQLFINPLYKLSQLQKCSSEENKTSSAVLPEPGLPSIEIWMQCYYRWLPLLSIKAGGRPQIDIIHRQLLKDIQPLLSGSLKKSGDNCGSSNNHTNNNNNNHHHLHHHSKENSINHTKSGSGNSSSFSQNSSDLSRLSLEESSLDGLSNKEMETLLKNRDVIDNFFPFAVSRTSLSSANLANSSTLSEFDTQSVLNLTD